MAVIIDFARLISPGRKAKPGTDRTRLSEVVGILDGGGKGGCRDRAYSRDRHQQLASFAPAGIGNQLVVREQCILVRTVA